MEYRVKKLKESILIKVIGPINKNAKYSARSFLEPFLDGRFTNITLDIDNLENDREIVCHIGLVNSFKKAIDQVGGKLFLKVERSSIRKYLHKTGMDRLFYLISS